MVSSSFLQCGIAHVPTFFSTKPFRKTVSNILLFFPKPNLGLGLRSSRMFSQEQRKWDTFLLLPPFLFFCPLWKPGQSRPKD